MCWITSCGSYIALLVRVLICFLASRSRESASQSFLCMWFFSSKTFFRFPRCSFIFFFVYFSGVIFSMVFCLFWGV